MQQDFTFKPSKPVEEPRFVKEMLGQLPPSRAALATNKKAKIPSRQSLGLKSPGPNFIWVPELKRWEHFATAKFHLNPPVEKRTPTPWPETCFMNRGKPYLKFETEKAANSWLSTTGGKSFKTWQCMFCKKFHHIPYPQEPTGTTSGKSVRTWSFLLKMGKSPEEVYGLTTTKK